MSTLEGDRIDNFIRWQWDGQPEFGIYDSNGVALKNVGDGFLTHYPPLKLMNSLPSNALTINEIPVKTPVGSGYLYVKE